MLLPSLPRKPVDVGPVHAALGAVRLRPGHDGGAEARPVLRALAGGTRVSLRGAQGFPAFVAIGIFGHQRASGLSPHPRAQARPGSTRRRPFSLARQRRLGGCTLGRHAPRGIGRGVSPHRTHTHTGRGNADIFQYDRTLWSRAAVPWPRVESSEEACDVTHTPCGTRLIHCTSRRKRISTRKSFSCNLELGHLYTGGARWLRR